MAVPPACPARYPSRIAAGAATQGISTGAPFARTTTVRGLASQTASISRSCCSGRRMWGAVEALGFVDGRQAGEDDGDRGAARRRHRVRDQRIVALAALRVVAGRVGDLRRVRHEGLDGVKRAVEPCRRHLGTSGALITRLFGEGADHGDGAVGPKGQEPPFVLEEDGTLGGRAPCQGVVRVLVQVRVAPFEFRPREAQRDVAAHGTIEFRLRQPTVAHCLGDAAIVDATARGHFQVEAGGESQHPVVGGAPVRHDQPLESPLLAKHLVQQPLVLAAVDPVQAVVGTHDRPRPALAHHGLEAAQVDFPQGAFVHDRVDEHAAGFLIVGGEVLDARAHALGLDAVDQRGRHCAADQWILGEILEVPAAQGMALDVHARPEQHGDVLGGALFTEGHADFAQQVAVPGTRERRCRRKARGRHARVEPDVVCGGRLLAQTVRAVGDHDRGHAEAFVPLEMPEAPA